MAWFNLFRNDGHNTYYSDRRSPVLADITHVVIILLCIMFSAALLIVIIGTRGRERWTTFLRVAFTLHTGVAILVTLFGQDWQVAFVHSHCSYSTLFHDEIMAYINVKVGLKSVNVTLQGEVGTLQGGGRIDYNERFNFDHVNDMETDVLDAKERGLPQPILYVAEYFGVDSGGLRWNRAVREAGHFVFILQWAAFAAWLVSNVVVNFVVFHGAAIMTLTGGMMAAACALYDGLQPASPFTIPFEDAYIHFHYGWCFWVSAVSGGLTLVTGAVILVLYKMFPLQVQMVFLLDTSHLVEELNYSADSTPLELEKKGQGTLPKEGRSQSYVNTAFTADSDLRQRPTSSLVSDEDDNKLKAKKRRVSSVSFPIAPISEDIELPAITINTRTGSSPRDDSTTPDPDPGAGSSTGDVTVKTDPGAGSSTGDVTVKTDPGAGSSTGDVTVKIDPAAGSSTGDVTVKIDPAAGSSPGKFTVTIEDEKMTSAAPTPELTS